MDLINITFGFFGLLIGWLALDQLLWSFDTDCETLIKKLYTKVFK